MTLKKIKPVQQELSQVHSHYKKIVNDFNHAMNLMREKRTKSQILIKKVISGFGIFMLWRAIRKDYRETGNHGIKELSYSTYRVMQKRETDRTIRKAISRFFE